MAPLTDAERRSLPTEEVVRAALAEVHVAGNDQDIVSLGLVRSVALDEDRVSVSLVLSAPAGAGPLREAVERRLREVGASRVEVKIGLPQRAPVPEGRPRDSERPPSPAARPRDPWSGRGRLPNVARVVAVGAGKGGVGKSTVAVGLALALQEAGRRVGVLDADIYGPSVPVLVGLEDGASRVRMSERKQIIPLEALGLSVVSFGFFLGSDSPAVWRGPLVGKAVQQFSRGVLWPELDVLVVDLPPGTGDVPLSLAQSIVVDGAVVVTTPQRLAVLEAGKAVEMFRKLDVPVLGVVENMAHAECACGRRSHPFGQGGGARLAEEAGVALLGAVPFDDEMVAGGDRGEPSSWRLPDSAAAAAFRGVARRVAERLEIDARERAPAGAAP